LPSGPRFKVSASASISFIRMAQIHAKGESIAKRWFLAHLRPRSPSIAPVTRVATKTPSGCPASGAAHFARLRVGVFFGFVIG